MNRLVIVSNRLPLQIERKGDGFSFTRSVGGLATGLGAFHDTHETVWIGWADIGDDDLDERDRAVLTSQLDERGCVPVFLTKEQVASFYNGFCNSTLWPLFHTFPQHAHFDQSTWEIYKQVNSMFSDVVRAHAEPGDIIWVQDYHLMLLPNLIREVFPEVAIGWFLHIPFPSSEMFRMLPWRKELLQGVLGANLIGFHIYDYVQHFLSSCRRLIGTEDDAGSIVLNERIVRIDAFPMGIDYACYRDSMKSRLAQKWKTRTEEGAEHRKIMLSVDRLDYSKGIPNRLHAFSTFLERYPEWRGRITFISVTVPSREDVDSYQELEQEVNQLVGEISGKYATIGWTPVRYFYRSLVFDELCGIYAASDIALITPLRDGMNLVAKEYLAVHDGQSGVLILSETAGAARELGEAIQVNPYDEEAVVGAIHQALIIPEEEACGRNAVMQARIRRYDVTKWAEEFLGALHDAKTVQEGFAAHRLGSASAGELCDAYARAVKRLLLFDYDGTLMPFSNDPTAVFPTDELRDILCRLGETPNTTLVIISGRDRQTLEEWLGDLPLNLVAEHGAWERPQGEDTWFAPEPLNNSWQERILPLIETFVDRTPGSFVEVKECSLVWHYRKANAELAATRLIEIKDILSSITEGLGLTTMEGNKVLEVRPVGISKGHAAHYWIQTDSYDFVCALGDDRTDEDMFQAAPEDAWTIKVGFGPTFARYLLKDTDEVHLLLQRLEAGSR